MKTQDPGDLITVFAAVRDSDRAAAPAVATLYRRLRDLIDSGGITAGRKLPSTRTLSREAHLSRTTVEDAYSRLEAEGYIVRRRGSGSFVARNANRTSRSRGHGDSPTSADVAYSIGASGSALVSASSLIGPVPSSADITPCTTEEDLIPSHALADLFRSVVRESPVRVFRDGDAMGYGPLRAAVARLLASERGLHCTEHNVMILNGTQHAMDLCARIFVDPDDTVAIENPCYPNAAAVFRAVGAEIVPVPVDRDGMSVDALRSAARRPKLIYTTPSHQFPLGVTMTAARRRELAQYAADAGAIVLEDDYDSEFRYEGDPALPSITGTDAVATGATAVFAGTFNKVLFNTLRLSYLVIPIGAVELFQRARAVTDSFSATLPQAVLARFIDSGGYAAHLRTVRRIYREKRDALRRALDALKPYGVTYGPAVSGFRVAVHLPEHVRSGAELDENEICREICARSIDRYYLGDRAAGPGLVVGYGRLDEARIDALSQYLRSVATR